MDDCRCLVYVSIEIYARNEYHRDIFSSAVPNDITVSSFPPQGLELDVDIKHTQVGKKAGSKTCIETDNATIQEPNRAAEQ